MRWLLRFLCGALGVALVAVSFVAFFHLVPASWGFDAPGVSTVTEDVRARDRDGWTDGARTRIVTHGHDGGFLVGTIQFAGDAGPRDRAVRAVVREDLQVMAAGAGGAALWSFPARGPFEARPEAVPIAELRESDGAPLVVAVDTFTFAGTARVAGLDVEHWVALHEPHRFVDDGRRFQREVERHAYVEPTSGVVVAHHQHERLWAHWQDRLRGDPITTLLQGPAKDNAYLPVWDAWTNTTSASASAAAERAGDVRTSRLASMVAWPLPALIAGELGLWSMVRPLRRRGA